MGRKLKTLRIRGADDYGITQLCGTGKSLFIRMNFNERFAAYAKFAGELIQCSLIATFADNFRLRRHDGQLCRQFRSSFCQKSDKVFRNRKDNAQVITLLAQFKKTRQERVFVRKGGWSQTSSIKREYSVQPSLPSKPTMHLYFERSRPRATASAGW